MAAGAIERESLIMAAQTGDPVAISLLLKVLSNYSNHAFGTELDAKFVAYKVE